MKSISQYTNQPLMNELAISSFDCNITINSPTGETKILHAIKKMGSLITINTDKGIIKCAESHILFDKDHLPINSMNVVVGSILHNKYGDATVQSVSVGDNQEFYDIHVDNDNHYFYDACGFLHHNTIITAVLSHIVESSGRSIVVVPNKSLVAQTEVDYRNLGLDVGVFYGEKKEFGHTHTISTWQSLHSFVKKNKTQQNVKEIQQFFKDVVCIIIDEAHSAKAAVLQELLCGVLANIPLRWGLTGTVPKPKHEFFPLLVSLGQVINHLSAKTLQDKGVLAQCDINVLKLTDYGAFRDYHQESEYLNTDKNRIEWIADKIEEISKTGNTLVLVKSIEAGKMITKLTIESKFIYGATKLVDRKELFDEINTSKNKVLVATYGLASVGINIPRLFNVVMIEPGKSFVRVMQTIGRGIRKAKDKNKVNIWDICSTLEYSDKHLEKRLEFYRDAHYPYNITEVDWK